MSNCKNPNVSKYSVPTRQSNELQQQQQKTSIQYVSVTDPSAKLYFWGIGYMQVLVNEFIFYLLRLYSTSAEGL